MVASGVIAGTMASSNGKAMVAPTPRRNVRRGNDFFTVMRSSPYFDPAKFNLILGVQTVGTFNTRLTHNASSMHDMLAIGPYIATRIDDYASNEQLFGGLFAEASWWSSPAIGTPPEFVNRLKYVVCRAVPAGLFLSCAFTIDVGARVFSEVCAFSKAVRMLL